MMRLEIKWKTGAESLGNGSDRKKVIGNFRLPSMGCSYHDCPYNPSLLGTNIYIYLDALKDCRRCEPKGYLVSKWYGDWINVD